MNSGIAIDFACGRLQYFGANAFGQAKHIGTAVDINLGGLCWVPLVMNRTGGASQVIDFIGLQIEGKADVMTNNVKIGVIQQMDNIALLPGEKVVNAYHFIAFTKKTLTKMTTEKPCSTRYNDPVFHAIRPPV
jgi:hypothetical protein